MSAWCGHKQAKTLEITSDTALWYRPGTPARPIRWVLVRDPQGKRAPQAFFSTDTTLDPADIIALFVRRWQIEVTFAETRAHLGVETQQQWSDKAIERTTPALLGLYSLVSLWACDLLTTSSIPYAAAWYRRPISHSPTPSEPSVFNYGSETFINTPHQTGERHKIPPDRLVRMAEALCFAA